MRMRPYVPLLPLLLFACSTPAGPEKAAVPGADSVTVQVQRSTPVENGLERIVSKDGRIRMEGDKRNGQRHGVWTSYGPAGKVKSRSEYKDGQLDGHTIVYRDNGIVYYTGENRKGLPYGTWTFYNTEGEVERTLTYGEDGKVIE